MRASSASILLSPSLRAIYHTHTRARAHTHTHTHTHTCARARARRHTQLFCDNLCNKLQQAHRHSQSQSQTQMLTQMQMQTETETETDRDRDRDTQSCPACIHLQQSQPVPKTLAISTLLPDIQVCLPMLTLPSGICTKVSSLHLIHCIFARRSACYLVASLLFMEGSFIIGSVFWRPRRAPETSCILEPREHLHYTLKFRAHSYLMLSCLTRVFMLAG
jgi:hypothetical protein